MKEYTIFNNTTNEENIIFGYNMKDAFRRYPKFSQNDWKVISVEYID